MSATEEVAAAAERPGVDRRRAEDLDAADPLGGFRERFLIPDPALVYLDGNSLGRVPLATVDRLRRVVEREWGDRLIRSWDERWAELPGRVGDVIGTGLLGARPGEVIVSDSTTVNVYKLAAAALDARPGRADVVTDRDNFPTDRYVVEGLASSRGGRVRWIDGDPVHGPGPEQVAAALDDGVALVTLSHVGYRNAAIADMAAITALAHEGGALVLWDLCHSVGAVPIDLSGTGVDLAVGCTYKYLNGGPGAPAFLYVREEIRGVLRQPIWGWWGRREMFEMEAGYEPVGDARAFLTGTPSVLALSAVEEGAGMLLEAGMPALREKSVALTRLAVDLFDAWLEPLGFELGSPRDAATRGSHVLVVHHDARRLARSMAERGVIPDFRRPNGIRLGLAPLTTRFVDVFDGMAVLADLAKRGPTESAR